MSRPTAARPERSAAARRVIRVYLLITGFFNAALALIWGVNTLFLLGAGLDIFEVMLVNAAFSYGQLVFEVPTGVVADTIGRRASLLMCLVTVLLATLAYVGIAWVGLGFWPFVAVSVVLGLGFTFYTGAVDAWVVDELAHVGYKESLEPIFARMQLVFGASMLVGTISGGLLGQVHLHLPYVLRAALVIPPIAIAWMLMPEDGFTRRSLALRELPVEMKRVFVEGVRFGLRHQVVRPLMVASFVGATFGMFGFYSWQRYFLDLLGRELVWVTGLIAALVALAGMGGNMLIPVLSRLIGSRTTVLIGCAALQAVTVILCGRLTSFYAVVAMYLLAAVAGGVFMPIKQSLLNAQIPSAQRATIISFDSLFADLGGGVGQSTLGYLSRARSIPDAWVAAGAFLLLRLPALWQVRRGCRAIDRFADAEPRHDPAPGAAAVAVPCEPGSALK